MLIILILLASYVSQALSINRDNLIDIDTQYNTPTQHLLNFFIKKNALHTIEIFALLTNISNYTNYSIKYNSHDKNNYSRFFLVSGHHDNQILRIASEIFPEVFYIKNYRHPELKKQFISIVHELDTNNISSLKKHITSISTKILVARALINACYNIDIDRNKTPIVSYINSSVNTIDFLDKYTTKFSYQERLGISYRRIMNFPENYYIDLCSTKYKKTLVNYPYQESTGVITVLAT